MKTFKILLLTLASISFGLKASSLSCAATAESLEKGTYQPVVIKVWNHNVGPVKDGAFLRDQIFAVSYTQGKKPGSGLFRIPFDYPKATSGVLKSEIGDVIGIPEDGTSALHELIIQVEVSTKDERRLTLAESRLGLPGDYAEFSVNVDPSTIEDMKIKIISPTYAYSTSAGCMWNKVGRPVRALSNPAHVLYNNRVLTNGGTFTLVASWPELLAQSHDKARLNLVEAEDYEPTVVGVDQLDPNWKETIGFNFLPSRDKCCFPTEGLNRSFGSTEHTDVLELGQKFAFYAGHEVNAHIAG